jgi:hypothetical protein
LRSAGNIAYIRVKTDINETFVGKPEDWRQFLRPRHRWVITMHRIQTRKLDLKVSDDSTIIQYYISGHYP